MTEPRERSDTGRGKPPNSAVVLLSGGLDSATTLAIATLECGVVHALTIDYGQRHAVEVESARRLAEHFAVASHTVLSVDLRAIGGSALTADMEVPKPESIAAVGTEIPTTYVPARNLIFLSLACGLAEVRGAGCIYIGVNAIDYSGYPDCRPEFIDSFESTVRLATKAGVQAADEPAMRVVTPLSSMSKQSIVEEAARLGVPLEWTVSCYDPGNGGEPCGGCDACLLRADGFARAGLEDPAMQVPHEKG